MSGFHMACEFPGIVHTTFQVCTCFCEEGTEHWPAYHQEPQAQEIRSSNNPPFALPVPALNFTDSHGMDPWPERHAVLPLTDRNLEMASSKQLGFPPVPSVEKEAWKGNAGQSSTLEGQG